MIIVTGSHGFIGSNLIRQLNKQGIKEILAVDYEPSEEKFSNLIHCEISDFMDAKDFYSKLREGYLNKKKVSTIFHQGACSDTMEWDAHYILKNNYLYSKVLLNFAEKKGIPFIYASSASVYGTGNSFSEERKNEKPINLYAYSKYLFDIHAEKKILKNKNQIVGLRYFNVYGPNESHKKIMASVTHHLHHQLKRGDTVKLFGRYDGFKEGEQKRDFVYIDDVIKVNLWFKEQNQISGIFNVGTGTGETFRKVAESVIEWNGRGSIEFIPFPKDLKGSYQSFTQANIDKLRETGYKDEFIGVKEGIKSYLDSLERWPSNE